MKRSPLAPEGHTPASLSEGTNRGLPDPAPCLLFQEELRAAFRLAVESSEPYSLLVLEPSGDCDCFVDLLLALAPADAGEEAAAFALGQGRFALLLPGSTLAAALALAKILELRLAFASQGGAGVWIGAAAAGAGTSSAEEPFARAHLAMLEAKTFAGGGTIAYGQPVTQRPCFSEAGTRRLLADLAQLDRMLSPPATPPTRERLPALVAH